ncbi:hypothetical protein CsatA_003661 [Cannabis sativa]
MPSADTGAAPSSDSKVDGLSILSLFSCLVLLEKKDMEICSRVAAVWKHTHFRVSIPHVENLNGHDIYAYLAEAHKDSDLEKILCLMWSIWTQRNKEIHGTRPKPAPNILIFVDSYVDQFRKAKHCATNQKDQAVCTSSTTSAATSSLTSNSATPVKWLPPLQRKPKERSAFFPV